MLNVAWLHRWVARVESVVLKGGRVLRKVRDGVWLQAVVVRERKSSLRFREIRCFRGFCDFYPRHFHFYRLPYL